MGADVPVDHRGEHVRFAVTSISDSNYTVACGPASFPRPPGRLFRKPIGYRDTAVRAGVSWFEALFDGLARGVLVQGQQQVIELRARRR